MGIRLTIRVRLFLLAGFLVTGVAVTGVIALLGSGTLATRVRIIGKGMDAVSATANQRGEKLAQAGEDSLRLGALSGQLGDEAGRLRHLTILAAREAANMRSKTTAALAATSLRLLDRRLENAKFLSDAMIKAADVRNTASGFIRALGRDFAGGPVADATTVLPADEEQRYALLDFLESLVSSAGADTYAVIGCAGELDGRVLVSSHAALIKRDLSEMALIKGARHSNRISRGIDRLNEDLILGSVALMKSSSGQDVALLLCGYSLDRSALRALDQDLGARLAVFLPDESGHWRVRHTTLVDVESQLIKAVPFPVEIEADLRAKTLKAQIEAKKGNRSVVDVLSLRAACRQVKEVEIDGAVYSAAWQGLIADSGELVGVMFIGRDVTAAVVDEHRILSGIEATGVKAKEITHARDQILTSTRTNQDEAKILAHTDSQAREQVNRAVAEADRIAGLTRNAVGVALALALVVGLGATGVILTRLTNRIQALLKASDRMAAGDYVVPIEDSSADEVGRLSRSFAVMQATVVARREELERFNADLEQRIHSRTNELSEKNRELVKEIEEREQAELSLRLLESAVNQIADSVMITTTGVDGVGIGIVYVNPAFTSITGYTRDEIAGKSPDLLFGPRTERKEMAHLFSELLAGRNAAVEAINYSKDGREVHLEWNAAPLRNKTGELVNLVAVQRDITQRKHAEAEIESMHRQLVDLSRQAGMTEVATGVLHNVGNVLNSVNVSVTVVSDLIRNSKGPNLEKVVDLLKEHSGNLVDFLIRDERGRQWPLYLAKLSEHLAGEREVISKEIRSLATNVEHIKEIVKLQQSNAKNTGFAQLVKPDSLVNEALRMHALSLKKYDIRVATECADIPEVPLDKHKILQILINLLSNARQALGEVKGRPRLVIVKVALEDTRLIFSVSDNGAGISPENINRIFSHGFTTKKDGHGFGLHSCALAAREMEGTLTVASGGPGLGACFTLAVPIVSRATQTIRRRPAIPPLDPNVREMTT